MLSLQNAHTLSVSVSKQVRSRCKGLSVGLPGLSVQLFCQLSLSFPGTCAAGARACLWAFQGSPCSCFANCPSAFKARAQQVPGPVCGPSRLVPGRVLQACLAFVQQLLTGLSRLFDRDSLQALCPSALQGLVKGVFNVGDAAVLEKAQKCQTAYQTTTRGSSDSPLIGFGTGWKKCQVEL